MTVAQRQNKGQGAGPECLCQKLGVVVEYCDLKRSFNRGHMHDQRIKVGAPLCGKHSGYRAVVARVRAQAIDRFGWKGDKTARHKHPGRAGQPRSVRCQRFCVPRVHHCLFLAHAGQAGGTWPVVTRRLSCDPLALGASLPMPL